MVGRVGGQLTGGRGRVGVRGVAVSGERSGCGQAPGHTSQARAGWRCRVMVLDKGLVVGLGVVTRAGAGCLNIRLTGVSR